MKITITTKNDSNIHSTVEKATGGKVDYSGFY
jgi:hypothetical protein